jgi:hypothetical protein
MRATTGLTAALLLSASLSACSTRDDGPTILALASPAPVSTSAEPSASSDIDVPVLPPEAAAQTAAGAIAFVRHYFAVVDYAYATSDTAPLAAVSDPACRPCAGVKDMIDTTLLAGGSWETEPTTVTEVSVPDGEPVGAVNVLLTYSSETARELSAEGDEVRTFPALVEQSEHLVLVPDGSSWRIFDYGDVV